MKRKKMPSAKDKAVFRTTANKTHKVNSPQYNARGGIRM